MSTTSKGKRAKPQRGVQTPAGVFAWPFLNKPSTLHKPDGVYKVDIVLPPDDPGLAAFRQKAIEYGERAKMEMQLPKAKVELPVKPHRVKNDAGEYEDTGELVIRCTLDAVQQFGKDAPKVEKRPAIVDAKLNTLFPPPPIGAGTVGRVSGNLYATSFQGTVHVKFEIVGVQILKLVEYGEFKAEDAFDVVEEGYEFTPADVDAEGKAPF